MNVASTCIRVVRGFRETRGGTRPASAHARRGWNKRTSRNAKADVPAEPWAMLALASDYRLRAKPGAPGCSQFPLPQDATARAIPSEMARGNGGRIEGHRFDSTAASSRAPA